MLWSVCSMVSDWLVEVNDLPIVALDEDPDDLWQPSFSGAEYKQLIARDPSYYCNNIYHLLYQCWSSEKVITNVENVLRPDLAWRFENYLSFLKTKHASFLSERRNRLSNLVEPVIGFHGTSEDNLHSIVRVGMIVPEKPQLSLFSVSVTCGSRLGKGIYISPDPNVALDYSRCNKLLVCAVLPGRSYKINDMSFWGLSLHQGYDSHISEDGQQVVLFHEV